MREESSNDTLVQKFLLVAVKDSDLQKTFACDVESYFVDTFPGSASFAFSEASLLHFENQVVDSGSFRGELAANRECAGDIRGIVVVLCTGIDQDQVCGVGERRLVLSIVQSCCVFAHADDGEI